MLVAEWPNLLKQMKCPRCRTEGRFGFHGTYEKYHFSRRISIIRVRCLRCRVTHALIPSFSLPGTSIGTPEAEAYLIARAEGASRTKAGRILLEQGMSESSAKRLDRMLDVAVRRGKALLAGNGDPQVSGLAWIGSVCGPTKRPLYAINRFGLDRRVNGLCFCRAAILQFRRFPVSGKTPPTLYSVVAERGLVDSR